MEWVWCWLVPKYILEKSRKQLWVSCCLVQEPGPPAALDWARRCGFVTLSEAAGPDGTRGPQYFLLLALILQESVWSPTEACYMKQNGPDASAHRRPENSMCCSFLVSPKQWGSLRLKWRSVRNAAVFPWACFVPIVVTDKTTSGQEWSGKSWTTVWAEQGIIILLERS